MQPYFGFSPATRHALHKTLTVALQPRPAQDAYRCSATTFCTRRLPLLCNHAPHKTLTVALQGTTYCEQEFNAVNVEIPIENVSGCSLNFQLPPTARAVVTSDPRHHQRRAQQGTNPALTNKHIACDMKVPSAFICPITYEMFRDPVVVITSGQTYERGAILRHFRSSEIEPCSSERVGDKTVIENWALRRAMQEWLDANPDKTPGGWERQELPPPGFAVSLDAADMVVLNDIRQHCSLTRIWQKNHGPAKWPGVYIDARRVVHLALSDHDIGSLPDSIGNLASLETMDLDGNKLLRLPESIGQLSMLQNLNLDRNELTCLPITIGNLNKLRVLDLDRNKLTRLPDSISNLAMLEDLDVDSNELIWLPKSIGNLTRLQNLYLDHNAIVCLPESIGNLAMLRNLNLDHNLLTCLPESIGHLAELQNLNLNHNVLRSLPENIVNLSALRGLRLNGNRLTHLPESIGNITH